VTKLRAFLLACLAIAAICTGLIIGALGLARLTLTHALYGIAVIGALILAVFIGMTTYAAVLRRRDSRGELD
jgi:bacteriorhodopsin